MLASSIGAERSNADNRRWLRTCTAVAVAMVCMLLVGGAHAADQRIGRLMEAYCHTCHAADGNSEINLFPKLAGQQRDYLARQLRDYLTGRRDNMAMMAFFQEIKLRDVSGLADYYASQKPYAVATVNTELVEAGRRLYEEGNVDKGVPACIACHQPGAAGYQRYPRLAGQHQIYTVQEMAKFVSKERSNDRGGAMRAIAGLLSEQEIQSVAEYLASLGAPPPTPPAAN